MSTKLYLGIALRLIILFAAGIAVTFLTPQLRDFLGDELHVHTKACLDCYSGCTNSNEPDSL